MPVYSVLESHQVVRKEGDVYVLNVDSLATDQIIQLTLLCNWLIPEHPLQLTELAELFDKDKNFFREDGLSVQEIEDERKQFVSDFSEQKIAKMKLDEYIQGKRDTTTFCYRLERTLDWFGSIKGSYAEKFGIFYDKKRGKYAYDERKYGSAEEAFTSVKNQLLAILAAGKTFQADKNWKALSDVLENASDIQSHVKSRILAIYFPDSFLQIHSTGLLQELLRVLDVKEDEIADNFWANQARLLEIKNSHPVMKRWSNVDFSHFIWHIAMERPRERVPYVFITSYDDANLQHSIRFNTLG